MKMRTLNYCENWLGGRDSNPDKQIQSVFLITFAEFGLVLTSAVKFLLVSA